MRKRNGCFIFLSLWINPKVCRGYSNESYGAFLFDDVRFIMLYKMVLTFDSVDVLQNVN